MCWYAHSLFTLPWCLWPWLGSALWVHTFDSWKVLEADLTSKWKTSRNRNQNVRISMRRNHLLKINNIFKSSIIIHYSYKFKQGNFEEFIFDFKLFVSHTNKIYLKFSNFLRIFEADDFWLNIFAFFRFEVFISLIDMAGL